MVTIKDMAKATGVSVGTVSKVLTGSEELRRISPGTARKIRQAAHRMGYRPNVNARALVRQKSQTLGVYVAPHPGDRITQLYVSPILEGICQAARDNHHDVLLIDFGTTDRELRQTLDKFLTRRVDGVILIYFHGTAELIRSIQSAGVPLAAINNFDHLPLNSVNLDNAAGISLVVEHLVGLGHRNIAFLGELTDQPMMDHVLRKQAFIDAVRRHGIESTCSIVGCPEIDLRVEREGPFCQEDGYHGTDWLIKAGRRVTAIVCYNDLVAIGALRRLGEAGINVPRNMSLVGFDNSILSAYTTPPLTTISHPTRQMGIQAVQILLERIRDRDTTANKTVLMTPELAIRESTGEAR